MASTEGTIQFAYDLRAPDNTPAEVDLKGAAAIGEAGTQKATADSELFTGLHAWRVMLRRLELLGQHSDRYEGYGYGNLSARNEAQAEGFTITASQTSGIDNFQPKHLVNITGYNLPRFWVEAQGQHPPSSETLTHAMIYAADPRVNWVFHVHCPELWQQAEALGMPTTGAEVGYGTLEMVSAVAELLSANQSRPLAFATLGHTDGIFSLGANARDAGGLLLAYLAKALERQVLVATQ